MTQLLGPQPTERNVRYRRSEITQEWGLRAVHERTKREPLKGSKRLLNLVEHSAVLRYSAQAGKESELTK
jgi:hypothetical protein